MKQVTESLNKNDYIMVDAFTTRMQDIVSTIRATLWKNSERNVLKNITDGNGYEGVVEVWVNDTNRNN